MANKVYVNPETPITFKPTGGTYTFNVSGLANANGRISAQYDRGAGAKPMRYKWRAKTKAAAALTAGVALEIYLSTSDGTLQDGNFSTADATFTDINKLNNLQPVGAFVADSTSNGELQIASGITFIFDRYVSVVWWNKLGQALYSSATDHEFDLIPIPDEIQ